MPQEVAADSSVDLLREFERTGRPEPFEAFMRRHASMVYATCLKVTRDPHDAEDATQATFLTLASKSRLNGEIRQPEAWLRKVAHRLSLDLIRSKKRRVTRENLRSEMNTEAAPLDSHDHADKGEIKGILNEELAKLPASYRMPLILHYFGGLSREEMAEQLKLKPSTLGVRLHRAREQLRRRLASRGILLPTVALTALLSEVVRQGVCRHMMSSTARQASAIVMGHASAPMFAASTGVDSIGALLSSLAHGKLKVLFSALVISTAISLSSAQVRALIPAAIRSFLPSLPSWKMPSFSLPKINLGTTPQFSAAVAADPDVVEPTASAIASVVPAPRMSLATAIVSTMAAGSSEFLTKPSTPSPRLAADTKTAIATAKANALDRASTFAFPAPAGVSSAESFARSKTRPIPAASVASRENESRAPINRASAPNSDLWNGVLATAAGGGGGGGGSGPPPKPFVSTTPTTPVQVDVPARLIAPVTGAPPALRDSSGRVAGNKPAATAAGNNVSALPGEAVGASVLDSSKPLNTTQTIIFNGTGVNHGGYDTEDWAPTQLNHVTSLDESRGKISLTPSTPPGYSFNYPSVPGTKLGVNGARATVSAAAGLDDPAASVSFVDTSRTPIPMLPTGHHFIGVWQLEVDTSFDSLDLLVRYDDLRAARLGLDERILKLWVSDGKGWTLMWNDPSFGRDVEQNLMWVTAGGGVKFFAASAPEPATLAVVVGGLALASRRRRH